MHECNSGSYDWLVLYLCVLQNNQVLYLVLHLCVVQQSVVSTILIIWYNIYTIIFILGDKSINPFYSIWDPAKLYYVLIAWFGPRRFCHGADKLDAAALLTSTRLCEYKY